MSLKEFLTSTRMAKRETPTLRINNLNRCVVLFSTITVHTNLRTPHSSVALRGRISYARGGDRMSAKRWNREADRAKRGVLKVARRPPGRSETRNIAEQFRNHGAHYFRFPAAMA